MVATRPIPNPLSYSLRTRVLIRTSAFFIAGLLSCLLLQLSSLLAAPSPTPHQAGFHRLPGSQTGILFSNQLASSRSLTNQILLNGSGVAAGDVDGDGRCDLYFCNLDGPNALYRNLGNWKFEEIAERSGVACAGLSSAGALLADINGDGTLDLVITTLGQGTRLYLNDGRGMFRDVSTSYGLRTRKGGTSMAAGDVNGDGFLELYVANYRTSALSDLPGTQFRFKNVDGKQVVSTVDGQPANTPEYANRFRITERGGIAENGEEDDLYFNRGGTNLARISFLGGGFLDERGKALEQPPFDWGLAVAFRDLNGDGLPDLYVCNDFDSPDRIWLNENGRRFRALPVEAMRKQSLFAMGVDFADINRDGLDDILVVDMLSTSHERRMNTIPDRNLWQPGVGDSLNRPQYSMNTLYLNRGDGSYAEIAFMAGLAATEWSWCPAFVDIDLDGWEDVLVTNGHERDARNMDAQAALQETRQGRQFSRQEMLEQRTIFPSYASRSLAFRNQHDLSFTNLSEAWGLSELTVSHGMALADLDDDGDPDLIINHLNHEAGIYRNEATAPRIAIRLKGQPPNTFGIGAKITVRGGPVTQTQEMQAGGRYLSSDQPQRTFAASSADGASDASLEVEVRWRSGLRTLSNGLKAGAIYTLEEPSSPTAALPPTAAPAPPRAWFRDVSSSFTHKHRDTFYDDYQRQALLPHKLSQLGPGISWIDVNRDGREDLVIGSGGGGSMSIFLNRQDRFEPLQISSFEMSERQDQTSILGTLNAGVQVELLAGITSYESESGASHAVQRFTPDTNSVVNLLDPQISSVGPLAMADVDGDGWLDLFAGGRVIPGAYPLPAESRLYRGGPQGFKQDTAWTQALATAGMVSGACFADLDRDGKPELILACDWAPVRVYQFTQDKAVEITGSLGLSRFLGCWNSVCVGDLNGDGRLDIIASNMGRNHKYQAHRDHPIRLYHGDWIGDGTQQLIEAWFDTGRNQYVPVRQRDALSRALPHVSVQFRSNQAYAESSIEQIVGEGMAHARMLEINWTESTAFLNRGNHFDPIPLPAEAQMATALGVATADFDGDGSMDLFISQNLFVAQPETARDDAGIGLILRGDGTGRFAAVSVLESGIRILGEQRGAAVADYNLDGAMDLAVGVNGESARLFQNQSTHRGLLVRFVGPKGNPHGIGVQIRAGNGKAWSPIQEVQAGSGYLSQNAPTLLVHAPTGTDRLEFRWPHQAVRSVSLPIGAKRIAVSDDGTITQW